VKATLHGHCLRSCLPTPLSSIHGRFRGDAGISSTAHIPARAVRGAGVGTESGCMLMLG
jgi:hypothetical protein